MTQYSDGFLPELKRLKTLEDYGSTPEGQAAANSELGNLDFYQIAANAGETRDESVMGDIEKMLRRGDTAGLQARLGFDRATEVQRRYLAAAQQEYTDRSSKRSPAEVAADVPVTVLDSTSSMLLGGLTLAAQAIPGDPKNIPFKDAELLRNVQGFYRELYSDPIAAHERLREARLASQDRENIQNYETGLTGRSDTADFLAGGRYQLQTLLDSAKETVSDPTLLSQGLVQGLTSMGEAIVAKGGLEIAGKYALRRALAKTSIDSFSGRAALNFAANLERISVGGAVGLTEGIGAYQQTLADVLDADPVQLYETSQPFRDRIAELQQQNRDENLGLAPIDIWHKAQLDIAQSAALRAAGMTGVSSAAIGALLPEGLQSPTRVVSKGRTLASAWVKDIVKETTEEGLQSGYGQLVRNVEKQQYIDPNQDLSEGIARQAGEGAVLGGLTSGILKSPQGLLGIGGIAAEGVGRIADLGSAKTLQRIQDEGAGSVQSLTAQTKSFYADDQATEALKSLAVKTFNEAKVDSEGRKAGSEALANLLQSPIVPELPAGIADLSPELQAKFAPRMYRVTAINETATALNATQDPEQRAVLTSILTDLLEPVSQFKQTPDALKVMEQSPEAKAILTKYQDLLGNIEKLPEVKKAIETNIKLAQTPAALDNIDLLAVRAQQDPLLDGTKLTSTELEKKIQLASSTDNKRTLTESQRKILQSSVALLRAREEFERARAPKIQNKDGELVADPEFFNRTMNAHLDGERTIESVGRQATVEDNVAFQQNGKLSAKQHMARIIRTAVGGDIALARRYLTRFGNFAQSHNNKLAALNKSYENGGKRYSYSQFVPSQNKFMDSASNEDSKFPEVWVSKGPKSLQNVHQVALEAELLTRSFNALSQAFPELKVSEITGVELAKGLQDSPSSKAVETKTESESTPKVESPKEPVAEAKPQAPKPVVEEPTLQNTVKEVVPEQKPAPVVTEEKPKKVAEVFGNLLNVPGKIRNYFHQAFKFNKDSTRLLGKTNSRITVAQAIQSAKAFQEFTGGKPNPRWTPEIAKAYTALLSSQSDTTKNMGHVLLALQTQLNEFLQSTWKDGITFEQALREGLVEANTMVRGKALNIIELDPKTNKFIYNRELIEQAVMAGLHWHITQTQRQLILKEDEILDDLGVKNQLVSLKPALLRRLSQGAGTAEAKTSLSAMIRRFWGVQGISSQPMGFTDAIPEAVAAEVIRALVTTELVKADSIELHTEQPELGIKKTITKYTATPWGENSPLAAYPELLEDLIVTQPEAISFYGTDQVPVRDAQLGNSKVKISPEAIKALETMQAQEFKLHMPMVNLVTSLSERDFLALFGHDLSDKAQYNKNDYDSRESKNIAMKGAIAQLRSTLAEMRNVASARNIANIEDLGKKFQYRIGSNNRIMMQGPYNPQSNKLMREVLLSTWSTLNLADQNGQDYKFLLLAFAQAMGEKIHTKSFDENIEWARKALGENGTLAPIVSVLENYLRSGGSFPTKAFRDAAVAAKIETSPLAVMALLEMARIKISDAEGLKNFKTPLYLEADGMTNGPFNTMGLLTRGAFSSDWVQNVRRGGLSFGSTPKTADKLLVSGDLYKASMIRAETTVSEHLERIAAQNDQQAKVTLAVANQLFMAMQVLLPKDITKWDRDTNTLTLERGLGKNPITQMVYGAQGPGIANGITARLLKSFYEILTKVAANPALAAQYQPMLDAMVVLGAVKVDYSRKDNQFFISEKAVVRDIQTRMKNVQEFTFSEEEQKRIQSNVTHLLVTPMRVGIEQVLGNSVIDSGKMLVRATHIQAGIARAIYLDTIRKKVDEKAAKYAAEGMTKEAATNRAHTEFLSHAELDKVWDETLGVMPIVNTDGQTFLVAKKALLTFWEDPKNREKMLYRYSRSLGTPELDTVPNVEAISDPSVAAIPYFTIGMGDARMVRELFQTAFDGTLQVYDGINVPVNRITEYGTRINKAALKAWQANVFDGTFQTFEQFTKNKLVVEALKDPKVRAQILSEVDFGRDEKGRPVGPEVGIPATLKDLAQARLTTQARLVAVSRVAVSMDQMAGTYQPFVSEGINIPEDMPNEEIASILNVEYHSALKELQSGTWIDPKGRQEAQAKPKAGTVETVTPTVSVALEPIAAFANGTTHESGAVYLTATALQDLTKTLKGSVSKEELLLLNNLLKSPLMKGVRLVTGSMAQVAEYQRIEDKTSLASYLDQNPTAQVNGLYSPDEKTIYLMDPTIETLVHELVHASTYQTVLAFYNGNKEIRQGPSGEAIRRLEGLMKAFLEGGDHGLDPESNAGRALRQTQREINNYRPWDLHNQTPAQKAAALNEFMAWTLSNQDLAKELRSKKADSLGERLGRLTQAAWDVIKRLIWKGRRAAPGAADGRLVLDRIRIYTSVVSRNPVSLQTELKEIALAHSIVTGEDQTRLGKILEAFGTQIARHIGDVYSPKWYDEAVASLSQNATTARAFLLSTDLAEKASKLFQMSELEQATFRMMVMAMATEAKLNPQAMTEAARLYDRFLSVSKSEDFLQNKDTDDQQKLHDAQEKLSFLTSEQMKLHDRAGRTTALPVFLALATVNEEFRKVLSTYTVEESKKKTVSGLDTALEAAGNARLSALEQRLSGSKVDAQDVREAVDALTQTMVDETFKARTAVENLLETVRKTSSGLNGRIVNMMRRMGDRSHMKAQQLSNSTNKLEKALSHALTVTSVLASEGAGSAVAENELSRQDKQKDMWNWTRELFGSDGLIGRVQSQAKIYDMYKKVRSTVAQMREQYREKVPSIIASKFKFVQPDERQQDIMYRFLGRSDLAVLVDGSGRTVEQVLQLVTDPTARTQEIKKLEAELAQSYDSYHLPLVEAKIEQLVKFMATKLPGSSLLRNAHAIANLAGQAKNSKTWKTPSNRTIEVIDHLKTLKYLDTIASQEQQILAQLYRDEKDAIEFTFNYLRGQRSGEMNKALGARTRMNHFAGLLPSETNNGHLVVVSDDQHEQMVLLGYERTGAYRGSNIERQQGTYSYYFSPEGGAKTRFNQGLIQNVQGTAYGVHISSGISLGSNAGVITDPDKVAELASRLHTQYMYDQNGYGRENLVPVFNEDGSQIVAFERTLDPEQLKRLERPQHLGKMIGHWRGRQVEELQAQKINEEVVRYLSEMYEKDKGTPAEERYVNLYTHESPVVQDAVSILSGDVRKALAQRFGEGNFPVRRNLINQIVGYRNASIGDMWTGNTNVSKEFQEVVKKSLITLLGQNAYRKMVWAERNWQAVTATMRTNIVVRSMTVSVANIISGLYQLKARGVPLLTIGRQLPKKFAELEYYTRTMARKIELEAEAYADPVRAGTIRIQIKNLEDSMKRLSIWPLIENGEFTSISDVGQTAQDFGKDDGTIVEKLEAAADKLPVALRNIVRQGYMSRDTALFQALQKSVQYSDFIMKAIFYDHVLEHGKEFLEETPGYEEALAEARQKYGADPEAEKAARKAIALGRVTEEFNNYDLPTGRGRGYLESIGLAWFLNYKIRAAKIGLSMIRNNPLDVLLFGAMPHPMAGGIPVTDNVFYRLFSGSLGNAFGPGMVVKPIAWNSWYNLFD